MAAGTFTVAGHRVRTSSQRRFVAFYCRRSETPGEWAAASVEIFKRSDSIETLRTQVRRQGVHSSRFFVIVDTVTGEVGI